MITLVNEFAAVLDSCVLLPINLCDLLLRLAEEPALFRPRWSDQILQEVQRNLRGSKFKISQEKAEYRLACMRSAFPEATIEGYQSLIEAMPNETDDRHVMAAAVRANADCIVTTNLKHFPAEQCSQFGIEVIHPDQFLVLQWGLDQDTVARKIGEQSAAFRRSVAVHLEMLRKSLPCLVAAVEKSL